MSDPRFDELVRLSEGEVTTRRAAELERELASSDSLRAEQARLEALTQALGRPAPGLDDIDLRSGVWARVDSAPMARPAPRGWSWLAMAAGVTLLASTAFFVLGSSNDGVREKGGQGSLVGFEAFVVRGDDVSPLGSTMHVDDALGFAYRNLPGSRARHLLLSGVDARGQVFWFYPAWTDAARPPRAVPIEVSNQSLRLGEAVRHALVPGRLELRAMFLEEPVSVLDAEAGRLPVHQVSTLTIEVLP